MARYRIVTHGTCGKWYAVQKKSWFGWKNLDRFFRTLDDAEKALELWRTEYENTKRKS
jgi:hypothetical protein